jgi:hypothetical protein
MKMGTNFNKLPVYLFCIVLDSIFQDLELLKEFLNTNPKKKEKILDFIKKYCLFSNNRSVKKNIKDFKNTHKRIKRIIKKVKENTPVSEKDLNWININANDLSAYRPEIAIFSEKKLFNFPYESYETFENKELSNKFKYVKTIRVIGGKGILFLQLQDFITNTQQVRICARKGCYKLFTPKPKGHNRKFCGFVCQQGEWKRKQKKLKTLKLKK